MRKMLDVWMDCGQLFICRLGRRVLPAFYLIPTNIDDDCRSVIIENEKQQKTDFLKKKVGKSVYCNNREIC